MAITDPKPLSKLSANQIDRFWSHVDIKSATECWPCNFKGGFEISNPPRVYRPVRIAYYLHFGSDPFPRLVGHQCDSPNCCNWRHLVVRTISEQRSISASSDVRPAEDRFWEKVASAGLDDCWPWQGYCQPSGHGIMSHPGGKLYVHRYSYTINVGPIPKGMEVCHRCDNPPCVNPAHLFIGTHRENMDDMIAKGRVAVGADRWNTKLTPESVADIRKAHARGVSQTALGISFGVSRQTIGGIVSRKRWRYVH